MLKGLCQVATVTTVCLVGVCGQHMQGGGAVGAHTGGARAQRYGSVSEYPYGFFIGGSSVPEMNGVYVKQGPDEDALKHHQWEVAFKHDLSGWWIGVAHAPSNAAYETVGGKRNEWLLVDAAGTARFGHVGETVIPGAGVRWSHLHRDGGTAHGHPNADDPSAVSESAEASDDEEELPWQLIYIGDPGMVERLRQQGRQHKHTVAAAIEGQNLPELTGSDTALSWDQTPPANANAGVEADLIHADALWIDGKREAAVTALEEAAALAAADSPWKAAILHTVKVDRLRMQRNFPAAIDLVKTVLHSFPAFKRALHVAGMVSLDAGNPMAASSHWTQLLKLDRKYPQLCDWLVRAAVDSRRDSNQQYFRLLELNHDFANDELKKAYRRQSRLLHPDREGGSTEAFEAIVAAYKTLGDAVMKSEYVRGDDIPRVKHYNGNQEQPVYEQVERQFFPERFGFEPFGDPFETKRHLEEDRYNKMPAEENGEGVPIGTYLDSCRGCSVNSLSTGQLLTCTHCRGNRQIRVESSIRVDECIAGDVIGNMDGQLVCETSPTAAMEDMSSAANRGEGDNRDSEDVGDADENGPGDSQQEDIDRRDEL